MIRGTVKVQEIRRKLEAARIQPAQIATALLIDGYDAIVAATPEDTGFLRASWYIEPVDRGGFDHPSPPNTELKRELDKLRRARKRAVPDPQAEFTGIYYARTALLENLALINRADLFAQKISFVNSASYAGAVNKKTGFKSAALAAANAVMMGRAASLNPTAARIAKGRPKRHKKVRLK